MRIVATRTDYLDAGEAILADAGHAGLKISALCAKFGLTTGSFYGYFRNFDAYVCELLERWEVEQTHRVVALSSIPQDPRERLAEMKRMAVEVPHEAESAIRAWSTHQSIVADAQRRVDLAREEALRDAVFAVVGDETTAHLLAAIGLSLLVGIQQLRTPVDMAELESVLTAFEQLVLSSAVGERRFSTAQAWSSSEG